MEAMQRKIQDKMKIQVENVLEEIEMKEQGKMAMDDMMETKQKKPKSSLYI